MAKVAMKEIQDIFKDDLFETNSASESAISKLENMDCSKSDYKSNIKQIDQLVDMEIKSFDDYWKKDNKCV